MALNDPGTYVDSPGGKIRAVVPFYWNGVSYAASRGGARLLYVTGTLVGNGADTTNDVLQTYTLPANTLANVGDCILIKAGGPLGATTDTKQVTVAWGGTGIGQCTTALATATRWNVDVMIVKTASNAQSVISSFSLTATGAGAGAGSSTQTKTDTSAIIISIAGQNSTNSVAGSVGCQLFSVAFTPAP